MVWGLGRAQLLWPARLLEGMPAGWQRAVLAHELAHLKRRDHWVGWLQLAAACLWWWYPLFWYVRGQLRREAELACDALGGGAAARSAASLRGGIARGLPVSVPVSPFPRPRWASSAGVRILQGD